jgi:hypothetical protein
MSAREFANVFTARSNARRKDLYARNAAESTTGKRLSPRGASPRRASPKRASPKSRPVMSLNAFANVFTARSNARRASLNARAAAEYAARKLNAGSANNAAKMKRLSAANNAALRAFFKKATNRSRR